MTARTVSALLELATKITGFWILWRSLGWLPALGVFFVAWGNEINAARHRGEYN